MSGIERIAAERRRQIVVEGWTPQHDDEHKESELAMAAGCYARRAARVGKQGAPAGHPPTYWPRAWHEDCWKPEPRYGGEITKSDAIRMLEKAGALIAAEIDRLERQTS